VKAGIPFHHKRFMFRVPNQLRCTMCIDFKNLLTAQRTGIILGLEMNRFKMTV
jgi:hypothetical protein